MRKYIEQYKLKLPNREHQAIACKSFFHFYGYYGEVPHFRIRAFRRNVHGAKKGFSTILFRYQLAALHAKLTPEP